MRRDDLKDRREAGRLLIARANKEVSVFDVLKDLYGVNHPREGTDYKGYCPLVYEHPDDLDKGFRTYPATNSAYCFVQHGSLLPVRLAQLHLDRPPSFSARWLLEKYNLLESKDWRERWADLTAPEATSGVGDPQVLVEALHMAIETHPAYPTAGLLSVGFAKAMETVLATLDELIASGPDEAVVRNWFAVAKKYLTEELDAEEART